MTRTMTRSMMRSMMQWSGSIVVATLLGGCASAPECPKAHSPEPEARTGAETGETGPATIVLFVRHAEKESDGTSDPPLTERGQRRAACLADLLRSFEPDHLLTSEYQRTHATIEPLARRAGLTPVEVEAGDDEAWATALRGLPPGSRAVVAGHSNTLPTWVAALGGEMHGLDEEGNIPHGDYDRMITVIVDGRGRFVTSYTAGYCTEPTTSE